MPRTCNFVDLGAMRWAEAYALQEQLAAERKAGKIPDYFLIVEHPHVITMGRNGKEQHLLLPPAMLAQRGIDYHETNRGGDVTYHGPGQITGYFIFDLREWKKDVGAFVRGIEQGLIDALAEFGVRADRSPYKGETGVWVDGAKIGAIGVHLSRWVSTHGFALNVSTDLDFFRHIVPCGLTKPVTSLRALGNPVSREAVTEALKRAFARHFDWALCDGNMEAKVLTTEISQ